MIDINKYLTMNAKYQELEEKNLDFLTPKYSTPIDLKVFKYSKIIYSREEVGFQCVNAMVYITNHESIKIGDLLDGFVIQTVSKYYDFEGIEEYSGNVYECMCW